MAAHFFQQKIKYGVQAPDMVKPTFFLWKIIQNFFFLVWGIHILATQKKMILRGASGSLGAF